MTILWNCYFKPDSTAILTDYYFYDELIHLSQNLKQIQTKIKIKKN